DISVSGTVGHFEAEVISISDYYAFGSAMPSRAWTDVSRGYRYGFNGMEKDDEVKGEGNSYDFDARIYDSRLGRFLSVDPISYFIPNFSVYQFAGNSPISHIDIKGLFPWPVFGYHSLVSGLLTSLFYAKGEATVNDKPI